MTLNKAIIICCGIVALFAIVLFKCKQDDANFSSATKKISVVKNTPVRHYTDAGGTKHAEKPIAAGTLGEIETSYQHIIDSLSKLLKTKPKFIREIVQVSTVAAADFKPSIDTSPGKANIRVSYQDKWFSIDGVVSNDSSWRYAVKDSLSFITYRKKTGFLKKDLFLDAFSMNPNSTIKGLTAIRINEARPKKWAIALFGGYGFNGKAWGLVGGAGLTRSIVKL
jgi:hypothetical protein